MIKLGIVIIIELDYLRKYLMVPTGKDDLTRIVMMNQILTLVTYLLDVIRHFLLNASVASRIVFYWIYLAKKKSNVVFEPKIIINQMQFCIQYL